MRLWLLLAVLIAGPAFAQSSTSPQQPAAIQPQQMPGQPGIAVDAKGGQVIDPTKNVLDLVQAAIKRIDDLMVLLKEINTNRFDYEDKARDAEMRRLKEIGEQKERYDGELAKILRANQDDSSKIIATQLKELKTDLTDRISKLERFQYETSGKTTGASDLWTLLAAVIGLLIGGAGVAVAMKRAA